MEKEALIRELLGTFQEMSTQAIVLHQAAADLLGLNVTDHRCLGLLHRLGPMSAGRLAELTGLTTGAVTGIVDRLEKAGYAKRKDDPRDRRAVIVELRNSSRFERKISEIYEPLAKGCAGLLLEYEPKDLERLLDVFKGLVAKAREETLRIGKLERI